MRVALTIVGLAAMLPTTYSPSVMGQATSSTPEVHETQVPVGDASLYARTVGVGQPMIIVHGGPDFDHAYLLPDLDRLNDAFRLIYYDQRGRGRSVDNVEPQEVTLASDIEDLDKVRRHFRLDAPAIFGHSWGAVLALEYALRHPTHVSRLVLLNPAPVSRQDVVLLRNTYVKALGAQMDRQREIMTGTAYKEGDPEAVAARYRIHFRHALKRPDDYERLMSAMRAQFLRQGNVGIIKARAVEEQLMRDTWQLPDYDLLPKLRTLSVPTLVITGDHDFIPVEVSEHIAGALPKARLVTIKDCGHFIYLECPSEFRKNVEDFFGSSNIDDRARIRH